MIRLQNDSDKIITRSIHYLGSKLRMLDSIKQAIDLVDPQNGLVCDLFSGSGTVSKYLLQFRDVTAVDIQVYSQVICEASMSYIKSEVSAEEIVRSIKDSVFSSDIMSSFSLLIDHEKHCTHLAELGSLEFLYEIIENGSLYIFEHGEAKKMSTELEKAMSYACTNMKNLLLGDSADTMITRYYGGLYFSYEQAIALDCIAHEVFEKYGLMKTKMLAALLSTASELVNTVGKQFAQPLKVRDARGSLKESLKNKILTDRSLNTFQIYEKWLSYYFSTGNYFHKYSTLCMDYVDALNTLKGSNVKVVYADPPYTRYHYSRYYHVLETICLRDNPPVSTTFPNGSGGISRAIYRSERHQSPFCIKSKAAEAFDIMLQSVKQLNVPLVISYSPYEQSKSVTPRLQTMDQLIQMALRYYNNVDVASPGNFSHSKLNAVDKNFETNYEAEKLIICR